MSGMHDHGFLQSVKGKVLLGFLLAGIALTVSWKISKEAFDKMLSTVNRLSQPSERLDMVNHLSAKIVHLSQFQNMNPADARKARLEYFNQSRQLNQSLDSLKFLLSRDSAQVARIDNMKKLLEKRDRIFTSYIGVRLQLMNNEELTEQVQSISTIISATQPKTDSTVKTTTRETRTTTLYQPEQPPKEPDDEAEKKKFLGIFKSKKKDTREDPPVTVPIIKKEEITIVIDTLVNISSDSSIQKVSEAVQTIEATQRKQTDNYVNREKQLAESAKAMSLQLREVMEELELDVVKQVNKENQEARELVNNKIEQIVYLMIAFLVILSILAYRIILDIGKSNENRKQLIRAKEEAENYGQAKQRFLANMSHEIRTPLQAIIGYTELISASQKPEQQVVESLKGASDHLLHLVNQVLDYSRIISNKYVIVKEPFDLEKVLDDILHIVEGDAKRKNISLDFNYDPALEHLRLAGDPFRLKQILLNLFSNALRFTDENGVIGLTVTGQKSGEGQMIRFEVSDTGIGISEEEQSRIFNEFEQANNETVNTYGGTGLGLSIVKELVQLQNGCLSVSSTPGSGSVFVIEIPYEVTLLTEDPEMETISSHEGIAADFDGLVWVIDDDRFIRDWCRMLLKKLGIRHETFESGLAVQLVPVPEDLKIVFTDMRMPGLPGNEVCAMIKEKAAHDVEVYVITAQALPEEQEMLLEMGFDGILMKPFKAENLLDVIVDYSRRNPVPVRQADFSSIEAMAFGDSDILKEVLEQFMEDTAADLKSIEDMLVHEESANGKIADFIHKLAGRVGQLGAFSLSDDLKEMELVLRADDSLPAPERIQSLLSGIRKLMNEVQTYVHYSI